MNFVRNLPKIFTKFVLYKSSVAIKNGKSVGKTEFAQSKIPSLLASKFELENRSRQIKNATNIIVKKFFFREITRKFIKKCHSFPNKFYIIILYKILDLVILM